MGDFRAKAFIIFEFIKGQHIEEPGPHHQAQVIQKAAELQTLTRDYKPRYHSYRLNYDIPHCRELGKQAAGKIGTQTAHAKFAWLDAQLAALELPEELPKGVCHCDFHYSNLLFRGDQFVGLVDFDDANYTCLTFDLINMIDYWAWPFQSDHLDLPASKEIVQAYHAHRPLEMIEQRHLFDVHKLGILFDCIWFFERGEADDFYEKRKIEYLDGLGRAGYAAAHFDGPVDQ